MIQYTFFKKLFTVLTILAVLAFIGCEKKTEQKQDENQSELGVEERITVPNVRGTWSGIFDKRATTFNITEQTDSSFSGKITINYRQVINQDVKGSFSPTTKKMTMKDQLHSRYQGKYSGKLSDDLSEFSGTFTMDLDGKQFSFNLTKK